jgi:hypothetical protein
MRCGSVEHVVGKAVSVQQLRSLVPEVRLLVVWSQRAWLCDFVMNFAVKAATEFDDDPELLFVPGTSHKGLELIEVLVDGALSLVEAIAL